VLPAFSGAEAIHLARHFQPHCIAAEVLLRDMNWLAFAIALQEELPGTKLLFISSEERAETVLHRVRLEGLAARLLSKTALAEELLQAIHALLGGSGSAVVPSLMAAAELRP
jgi:DNA-binding NarL/FixJ family response regulator